MTRERWQLIAPLVDAVLDQPPARRLAYVAEISGGDAELAEELARFVGAYGEKENEAVVGAIFAAASDERSALMSDRLADSAADLQAQLEASLGASYVFDREIGGGGMARVFVAEEPGLGRKVVIKVLPPETSEGISAERFAREIKLAASLQQANIVPLLAAGTAAGFSYYTMPFVEGRSLRDRLLREGALPVGEAIGILRDVARALAFAHSRGVIHRDIKPGNILLSDRTAVVTDFGIAKALGAAREGSRADAIHDSASQTGTIGTPAYMAPEQASGDPNLDHRADIYSFGCMAYELLTGRTPFIGVDPRRVIDAHLEAKPRSVTERRPEVPAGVANLVASCLEKLPSRRPQSADEVLTALDALNQAPAPSRRRRWMLLAISSGVLAGVALFAYLRAFRTDEPLTFVAVPFRNVTHDPALDYRSDGIGDEISSGMVRVKGVQVVGRNAVFRYKDPTGNTAPDVNAISRDLGVRLVLTGTYREADGRVAIYAQLTDSTTRGEIWSGSFNGTSTDFSSIADEIVLRLTDTLRARFGSRVSPPPRVGLTAGTRNAEASDLYLIGQAELRRRGFGIAKAIDSFQGAIHLDSNFARAHAGLASALTLAPFFVYEPPAPMIERSIVEANRALELDSTLADAWVALGAAHGHTGQWEQSNRDMFRAIALEPGNSAGRQTFARQLIVRGLAKEGLEQLERAQKIDPNSPTISAWLAYALFLNGRPEAALAENRRTVKLGPWLSATANLGALLNLGLKRDEDARHLIGMLAGPAMTNEPYVYAKVGDMAMANQLIRDAEARNPRPWFIDVAKASVMLAVGDSSGAMDALERSERESGALWVYYIPLGDPTYDLVRKSRRFREILRQANIDLRVVEHPRGAEAP
jgi:serine/threonine-protein kinase